jgi:hypothetical protein
MDKLQERMSMNVKASAAAPLEVAGARPGAGDGIGALLSLDPLGLDGKGGSSEEQSRPKALSFAGPGRVSSSLLAAKDRLNLLQKLQQAPAGRGPDANVAAKGKYTRNRSRAMKASAEAEGRMALGVSIEPQDDNFDPILFLTVKYGAKDFLDLQQGQAFLKKAMGTQTNKLQQLVRQHYESFVRCADGIHWFKNMIAEEFIRPDGQGKGTGGGRDSTKIGQLQEIVTATEQGAFSLFSPLLERMDKTRTLRSARLMLQRLAKVLDVPGRMAKFMRAGQYEEVVREYERVRALPTGGGVQLLKRVQEQAEVVADELRSKLKTYLASDSHTFEELLEAADLLARLGGLQEPLLHCFFAQAQLLYKELGSLDAWYARGIDRVLAGEHDSDEDEEDEEDEEDDTGGEGKRRRLAAKTQRLVSPTEGDDGSDAETDSSGDEEEAPGTRRGDSSLDYSVSYALGSVEHEASSLRLNLVRRLVKNALRFVPTLLKLASLVAEDLPSLRIIWEPRAFAFTVKIEEKGPASRFTDGPAANEVLAASAALELVVSMLQRVCDACKKAMFGAKAAEGAASTPKTDLNAPALEPAYFREGLRSVSELYDELFKLDAELELSMAKAVLPPLKTLVEEAQRRQTQSVLDRLAAEVGKLLRKEEEAEEAGDGRGAAGRAGPIGAEEDPGAGGFTAGTSLPRELHALVHSSLEELASTLVRPFWCAKQVATGLQGVLTRTLEEALAADSLSIPDACSALSAGPSLSLPQVSGGSVRALARIGNCIQLDGKYLALVLADARRLFEAELPSEQLGRQVQALHDRLMRSYLDLRAQEISAAVKAGWMLKHKGLHMAADDAGLPVPGYVVQVLMCLVRSKIEVKEAFDDLPVLGAEDRGEDETYMDVMMTRLARHTAQSLTEQAADLSSALQQTRKTNKGSASELHASLFLPAQAGRALLTFLLT